MYSTDPAQHLKTASDDLDDLDDLSGDDLDDLDCSSLDDLDCLSVDDLHGKVAHTAPGIHFRADFLQIYWATVDYWTTVEVTVDYRNTVDYWTTAPSTLVLISEPIFSKPQGCPLGNLLDYSRLLDYTSFNVDHS